MSAQHTPGPWTVSEDDSNGQAVVRGEHIEVATCWHHCVVEIEREMRANARLIAAAPAMLEALRAMTHGLPELLESIGYSDEEDMIGKALSAISLATGESK